MDWSNPIGSAFSGTFGLLGNYLNYRYQSRLAEQQNKYNLEMWNLQNEYNSPQAQMKRFEEAGLNPMLIYNQGNSGNASSAPQMVTPEAPQFSKDMRDLAQAFNIEGLKTAIANRKKAEADAKDAGVNAERNHRELRAEEIIGTKYTFDPSTGMFVVRPTSSDGQLIVNPSAYYANRLLSDQFRTNVLLLPRREVIGTQSSLNRARNAYLAPQIRMGNFQATPWRMKTNFWLGNVKTGVQAVQPFLPYL